MTTARTVPGLPFTLSPSSGEAWIVDEAAATVTATAAARSDIFIDPGADSQLNAESMLNAATLLGVPPAGDFQFSARVTVDFAATFDAGVLLLWIDDRHWGKLCFEYSPDGEPMIVSVVARGVADDANAFVVDGRTVWLRVSRVDHAFAYHASLDGRTWRMIRFFTIDDPATSAAVGFEAQSPTGDGCVVTFDDIHFTAERLHDLRNGS
jgi:regulation of enolase protein 1 (concanavalin A-like superfamily)